MRNEPQNDKTQEAHERLSRLFDEIERLDSQQAIDEVANLDEAVELLCHVIFDRKLSRRLITLIEVLGLSRRYQSEICSLGS